MTKDLKTSCITAYTDVNAIVSTGNDEVPVVDIVANLADSTTAGSVPVAAKIGSTSLTPSKPATTTPLSSLHSVHLPRNPPECVDDSGASRYLSEIVRTHDGQSRYC